VSFIPRALFCSSSGLNGHASPCPILVPRLSAVSRKQKIARSRGQRRSVSLWHERHGRKTTILLEEEFWVCLKEIALVQGLSQSRLIATIDEQRQHANLSSAVRVFVLEHYRRLAEEAAPGGKGKRS
jgi:predicted DNA-binding ribbon-helix-helix protein